MNQIEKSKRQILKKAYSSLEYFIVFFLENHILDKETNEITPFNQMALDYFKLFKPNEIKVKRVIRASRGAAKTTLITLADTLHRMCFSTEKFIVIFSSTQPLSSAKIKDIRAELINNHKLNDFFDINFSQKRISTEQFTIKTIFGHSTIKAQSFFSQIRGIKKQEERPTRMIFDDPTHGERVFSEVQREKAKRQYRTDIVNAGQPNTNYIFVGTTIHKDDLVTELSRSPLWQSSTYPAIEKWPENMNLWDEWEKLMLDRQDPEAEFTADKFYKDNKKEMDKGSKVLWPEREPLIDLMKLRIQGRREFDAEKQMKPYLSGEALFDRISWFRFTERNGKMGFLIEENEQFIPADSQRWQIYYALDPATGEKKTQTSKKSLSFSSRIIVYRDIKTNRKFVLRDKTDRESPTKIIREMIEWHNKYLFQRIGVEGNLFKDLYMHAVREQLRIYESETGGKFIKLPIYEIYQKQPKEQRIYSLEPKVYGKEVLFCRGLSNEAIGQIENYPSTDHNDFLDALEIACKITDSRFNLRPTIVSLSKN